MQGFNKLRKSRLPNPKTSMNQVSHSVLFLTAHYFTVFFIFAKKRGKGRIRDSQQRIHNSADQTQCKRTSL